MFPPAWPQRRGSEEHELPAGAAALLRHHHHGRWQADVPGSQSGAGCWLGLPQGPVFTEPLCRATGTTLDKPQCKKTEQVISSEFTVQAWTLSVQAAIHFSHQSFWLFLYFRLL